MNLYGANIVRTCLARERIEKLPEMYKLSAALCEPCMNDCSLVQTAGLSG